MVIRSVAYLSVFVHQGWDWGLFAKLLVKLLIGDTSLKIIDKWGSGLITKEEIVLR